MAINIKPSHRGLFTAEAKAAGQGVQQYAVSVLSNPNASPKLRKRAAFAKAAAGWSHK